MKEKCLQGKRKFMKFLIEMIRGNYEIFNKNIGFYTPLK